MHCISCTLKRKVKKHLLFKQTLRSRFTCLACQHFSFDAKKSLDREGPFSLALRVVSLFSCLSRLAPSVTRVAICVSRVLLDGLQKKERLLVVYPFVGTNNVKIWWFLTAEGCRTVTIGWGPGIFPSFYKTPWLLS